MDDRRDARTPGPHTRRDVIRYGVAGGMVLAAGGTVAACGGGGSSTGTTPSTSGQAPSGPPKRGGVLRVGFISGGGTETLDPWKAYATNDYARVINLYDTLYAFNDDLTVSPALAESGEANGDNTEWTFRLRDGVTFHDGSTLTADDVVHTVEQWVDPSSINYVQVGFQIDPKQIRKVDERTVPSGSLLPTHASLKTSRSCGARSRAATRRRTGRRSEPGRSSTRASSRAHARCSTPTGSTGARASPSSTR